MIWTSILAKIGPPAVLAAACFGAGMFTMKKLTRDCPQPAPCVCQCPEPTVSVQPFDVDKIKNLKSFTYAPEFTGSIRVAGVDSVAIRRYIEESVSNALSGKRKKRK